MVGTRFSLKGVTATDRKRGIHEASRHIDAFTGSAATGGDDAMIRILNAAATVVAFLSAIVFLAYIGLYYFNFGLFAVLPETVRGFFTSYGFLQYIALATFIGAVAAKIRLAALMRAEEAEAAG